ncbi:N-acetylglucosaminyl deacetylase, LmbE family [Loktanella fryxellensis]|uniref:N-acetylglucosaminyl deacetylase, LmbE family n=1 Tax=Loktanella fryxellensis TaxID=245187 RepID=A0A1H8H988_9RHOB|nr:PIG-L family deacetylase [Loktanella fryxellensis]SEN52843.1 N-acetylglucosaminyl deacetylase, LmbE family [Loktanella fryxellensis]
MDVPVRNDPVAGLPRIAAESLTGGAPIVVLAPHPDDESLGCGALLAHAFATQGAHVVCMTDGSGSHPASRDWPADRLSRLRRQELSQAVALLGGGPQDITWLGHPDGWLGLQDRAAIVADLADLCTRVGARHLFAPAPEDHHEDHRHTAAIARRVVLALPHLTLFDYPVWSRWDDPDLLDKVAGRHPTALDPAPFVAAKRAAIAAHRSQRGLIVTDDPDGFCMSDTFQEAFATAPELYWKAVP